MEMVENFYYSETPFKKYKGGWSFRCVNCERLIKVFKEQKGSYFVWNPQMGYPFSIHNNQFLLCSKKCCEEGISKLNPLVELKQ